MVGFVGCSGEILRAFASQIRNAERQLPAMRTFKYQMLRVYGVDPSKHERALNETGQDGWELISVLSRKDDVGDEYVVYYLKKTVVGSD